MPRRICEIQFIKQIARWEGEFIVSPNKSILTFNSDLIIESDTYRFEKDAYAHLEDYRDEFLKGFYFERFRSV